MKKEEFKQIRIDFGLSQQKMADLLDIKSGRTIRRFESGEWPVSNRVIVAVKKLLAK